MNNSAGSVLLSMFNSFFLETRTAGRTRPDLKKPSPMSLFFWIVAPQVERVMIRSENLKGFYCYMILRIKPLGYGITHLS